jgi:hypothetical protein
LYALITFFRLEKYLYLKAAICLVLKAAQWLNSTLMDVHDTHRLLPYVFCFFFFGHYSIRHIIVYLPHLLVLFNLNYTFNFDYNIIIIITFLSLLLLQRQLLLLTSFLLFGFSLINCYYKNKIVFCYVITSF